MVIFNKKIKNSIKYRSKEFENGHLYDKIVWHLAFVLFVYCRKDIPECEFPGSDIYKDTIELLRLEAAYEDFLHSEG